MLLTKVPGGWGDNRSLPDHDFAILFDRLPDVVFAYEVGGLFGIFYTLR